jgi:FkbM family methyltransferase
MNYVIDIVDPASFVQQYKEIFVDEIYEFSSSNKMPVIYDCGANIGMSILYFKQLYPKSRVVAFEADERICNKCYDNVSSNRLFDVELINKAVWKDNASIKFSMHGADGGSVKGVESVSTVQGVRLRDYLKREDCIDLLKIDIEGAETEVLNDCSDSLSNVVNIFIEYHSWRNDPQDLSEILKILENNGFRYHIDSIVDNKKPFLKRDIVGTMDLQVNIHGYRL